MKRVGPRLVAAGVQTAALLTALAGAAQEAVGGAAPSESLAEAPEPIRIEYKAARGCPSATEFQRLVFERTHEARLARDGEPARTFIAELRQKRGRVVGTLVIREPDGESVARRVSGRECTDVATVLALASALAIDPRAELAPGQTLEDWQTPEEEKPAPTNAASSTAPTEDEYTTGTSSLVSVDTGAEKPQPTHVESRFAIGLGPRVALGLGPEPSFGAGLLVGAYFDASPTSGFVGVEATVLEGLPLSVQGAHAEFRLLGARPEVCPFALQIPLGVLGPCVVGELGAVNARGSQLPDGENVWRFWAALEIDARWDVALGDAWFLHADLGMQAPFTRYRYVFDNPETTVHPVPPITGTASLKLGFRN